MNGLDLLLDMCGRGVRFYLDAERAVMAQDPKRVVTGPERVMLGTIKHELRALLLTELPDDPGEGACDTFDAPAGVAFCRRCARGLAEHFWRRGAVRTAGCDVAIGAAGETCARCGLPKVEHFSSGAAS